MVSLTSRSLRPDDISVATGLLMLASATGVSHHLERQLAAAAAGEHTPVVLPNGSPAQLAGQMCTSRGLRPTTVQVAVHGATYDSDYWNWPQQPATYNYVWHALAAGYAVYDVDRLGAGESTRPPSTEVNETSTVSTLHQVVTELRAGRISGTPYRYVEGVGHSFGSYYLTAEAAANPHDFDALVLTGAGSETSPAIASIPEVPASGVPTLSPQGEA
jgi:pimeloyl-ACP methyl ester carboxylesterase